MAEDPKDFSFERDVSPYATKLFESIGSNRDLSESTKVRLQSRLLGNVDAIEKKRIQIERDRLDLDFRRLQYSEGRTALENARNKRLRLEQDSQKIGTVKDGIKDILSSDLSAQEKKSKIAELQLDYSENQDPAISRAFQIGSSAIIPTPELSFSSKMEMGIAGVPQEIIDTGNPVLIGRFIGEMQADRAKQNHAFSIANASEKERIKQKRDFEKELLRENLNFVENNEYGEEGEKYMDPESVSKVDLMVSVFGTPEEKELFKTTRGAKNDKEREALFYKIQARTLKKRMAEPVGDLIGIP